MPAIRFLDPVDGSPDSPNAPRYGFRASRGGRRGLDVRGGADSTDFTEDDAVDARR